MKEFEVKMTTKCQAVIFGHPIHINLTKPVALAVWRSGKQIVLAVWYQSASGELSFGDLQRRHTTKKEIAMIKRVNQLVGLVLLSSIAGSVAFAKEMKKEITFVQPVMVNGTLVKKGNYEAVFNDQTRQLSIVKGRRVVASAPAQLEKRQTRDHATYLTGQNEGDSSNAPLVGIVFNKNNQATIVDSGGSAQ
jgi:hypothetical protein